MDQHNSTLDELLSEPIIRQVMASDGVQIDEIRHLVQQARTRIAKSKPSQSKFWWLSPEEALSD